MASFLRVGAMKILPTFWIRCLTHNEWDFPVLRSFRHLPALDCTLFHKRGWIWLGMQFTDTRSRWKNAYIYMYLILVKVQGVRGEDQEIWSVFPNSKTCVANYSCVCIMLLYTGFIENIWKFSFLQSELKMVDAAIIC